MGGLPVNQNANTERTMQARTGDPRFLLSGAAAGAVSALAFTALHHLLISDIWFSVVAMLVAGALCGLCLAWSYRRLFRSPSVSTWAGYNLVFVALLALLCLVSLLVYEPVTTIPELFVAGGPPTELIRQAMPLTVGFTLVAAALLWYLWGRGLLDAVTILLTCALIVAVLGLNVSITGLVFLQGGTAYLFVEQFGLTLFLNLVFVGVFLLLERKAFQRLRSPDVTTPPVG